MSKKSIICSLLGSHFQFHHFQNQLAKVTLSPSLMEPTGSNSNASWESGEWATSLNTTGEIFSPQTPSGGENSEWVDLQRQRLETIGRAQSLFQNYYSKNRGPFFFFYMQRLECRDVLVFSPTDDLNDPSPLRGQRWLQPSNKKRLTLFICLALFPAPDWTA